MWRKLRVSILLAGFLAGFLAVLWWLLRQPKEQEDETQSSIEIVLPPLHSTESAPASPSVAAAKPSRKPSASTQVAQKRAQATKQAQEPPLPADDLSKIKGIGPKSSSVLREAGITRYAQLAQLDETQLQEILNAAGLRTGRPATWSKQAKLAAAGEWQALEKLQSQL